MYFLLLQSGHTDDDYFFFLFFFFRPLLLLLLQDANTKVLTLRKYIKCGQIIWTTIDDYR